jgi:hypothetical protein
MRIHARCGIQEERTQQFHSFGGVLLVTAKVVGKGERLDVCFQLVKTAMICNLVDLRITLAIAPNVGQTVGRFWIRPEVRRLAHVVVFVAAGRDNRLINDRERTFFQSLLRLALELRPGRCRISVAASNGVSTFFQFFRVEKKDSGRLVSGACRGPARLAGIYSRCRANQRAAQQKDCPPADDSLSHWKERRNSCRTTSRRCKVSPAFFVTGNELRILLFAPDAVNRIPPKLCR